MWARLRRHGAGAGNHPEADRITRRQDRRPFGGGGGSGVHLLFQPACADQLTGDPGKQQNRTSIVLLLSENPSVKLQRHLQQKGFDVEVMNISDQPGWLGQVVSQPPGAVVLDFQPATDRGWELIQLLKKNPETRDVPVLFYNLSSELMQGSMLNMDYLAKPISRTELLQAWNAWG